MKSPSSRHSLENTFVLLLAGVFAVCVLMVLFTGARAYRALTQRDSDAYDRRICAQYVAAKIRHTDTDGSVFIGDFTAGKADAGDTLFLTQTFGGRKYTTRIYCWNGWVRELFAEDGLEFEKEDGTPVMEAEALSFTDDTATGLLTVTVTDQTGYVSAVSILPRSGEEIAQ